MKKWTDSLPDKLVEIVAETDTQIESKLKEIDEQVLFNQQKVLEAFKKNNVSETYFAGSTGYGYDDIGRDGLDRIYADVFKTESAMVRPQIVSGTHSISTALFGMLRPGDNLLYITGMPYDTIQEVIGVSGTGIGSMKEYGIGFDYVPLTDDDHMDVDGLKEKLTDKVKVVAIQRSRGYATRDSFIVSEIADMIKEVRNISKDVIIFIDNCYGEFSETIEPTEVGADIMAGSLIKNAGGGLAKTGGYIVGRADLIEQAGYRLTTPGTGNEEGATLNVMRDFIQGFFLDRKSVV